MSDESTIKPSVTWRRRIAIVLAILLAFAIAVGGGIIYLGVSTSLRAEKTLHRTLYAVRFVDQFVREKGRWPRSWEELRESQSSEAGDWSDLQEHVTIDFQPDAELIASQDPMRFDAIKPIGPYYEYRHCSEVLSLQETLRTTIRRNGGKAPPR